MKTRCPHCNALCTTRKTQQISNMYREITFVCNNSECGHVFIACVSPVRTLSPSAMPDPSVNLPLSSHINKTALSKALASSTGDRHESYQAT